ncbi:enoyl-CoA hydratase-related protein [Nocardiopsis ansamitocini]|uniref:Enoyl-CoA hydratase n=1 Tax=Nocardiopsis ansamitocini TaxID=1670832 RepID=A0A9W6P6K2_9ACTN|nr:enoyl-CoA hydratase-related protein [Nocardiopsis ansamitocini]GLU48071.1 enoyl-CoA hydratase [Nocardiopsis ansamitocini]
MPEPEEHLVLSSVERGVCTLTLNSPRNRNALSARLRTELAAGLTEAIADDDVRAVVLTGAGPAFCAGADLKEVAAHQAGQPVTDPHAPGMAELFSAIMDAPKPVMAVLNGPARAGGLGLVAAADIAIAPDTTTFAFTEVRIGVVPAIISVPVARRMDDRRMTRYFLTGETFDAATAAESGLITTAVAPDRLDEVVGSVLNGLRTGAPRALARTKTLLGANGYPERKNAFAEMDELSAAFFASSDAAEGRASFLEKRPPHWAL